MGGKKGGMSPLCPAKLAKVVDFHDNLLTNNSMIGLKSKSKTYFHAKIILDNCLFLDHLETPRPFPYPT